MDDKYVEDQLVEINRLIREHIESMPNLAEMMTHKNMYTARIEKVLHGMVEDFIRQLANEYGIELADEIVEASLSEDGEKVVINIPYNLISHEQETAKVFPFANKLSELFGSSIIYPTNTTLEKQTYFIEVK